MSAAGRPGRGVLGAYPAYLAVTVDGVNVRLEWTAAQRLHLLGVLAGLVAEDIRQAAADRPPPIGDER